MIKKVEKEMEKYIKDPVDINSLREKSFYPLKWLKNKNFYLTALANIAKKYLCIPATSTPSVCVFSLAGNIVTKKRYQLLPENVDRLFFFSNKKYFWLIFIAEMNIYSVVLMLVLMFFYFFFHFYD